MELTTNSELAALGAEVVAADLSSLSSLISGFSSANAIFVNTNFWEVFQSGLASGKSDEEASDSAYNTEINWGKNAAKAASQISELEKFVFSAFGSMKVASGGKYARCYHFEAKAVVVDYIKHELPQLAKNTSYIYAAAYSDNPMLHPRRVPSGTSWILWLLSKIPFLLHFIPRAPAPARNQGAKEMAVSAGGEYLMVLPAKAPTRLPVFMPHVSTGGYVRCLVEDEPAGTKLLAVDWWMGLEESMQAWEKVSGRKSRFMEVTVQLLCHMTGIREEVMEAAAYLAEFPYMCEVKDWIEPSRLKNPPPEAMGYAEYLNTTGLQKTRTKIR